MLSRARKILTFFICCFSFSAFGGSKDFESNIQDVRQGRLKVRVLDKVEISDKTNFFFSKVKVNPEEIKSLKLVSQKKQRVIFEVEDIAQITSKKILIIQKDLVGNIVPLFFTKYKKGKDNKITVRKLKKVRLIAETEYFYSTKWETSLEGSLPVALQKNKGRSFLFKEPGGKFGIGPIVLKIEDESIPEEVVKPEPTPPAVVEEPVAPPEPVVARDPRLDRFTVKGYVKLDAILNNKSLGGIGGGNVGDQLFVPSLIPLDASEFERNELTIHARQSRFSLKYNKDDFTAGIEFDLFAGQLSGTEITFNSHGIAPRLAYGIYKGILIGQYHSNIFFGHAYPETLDFGGPVGKALKRQPQVRVIFIDQESIKISAAIESPENIIAAPGGLRVLADDESLPDLTLRIENKYFSLGGVIRQLAINNAVGSKYKTTYGGVMAGRIPLGVDDLRYNLIYGAIGSYSDFSLFADGVFTDSGQITPNEQITGSLAYRRVWGQYWRTNFVFGYGSLTTEVDPENFTPTETKYATSFHFNNIFTIGEGKEFGLEYLNAYRRLYSGDRGRLERWQFTVKFNFD